jgi:hypothetical protein
MNRAQLRELMQATRLVVKARDTPRKSFVRRAETDSGILAV